MAQTKYKFKPGDLVRVEYDSFSYYGIGIIVNGPIYTRFGTVCNIYFLTKWTKRQGFKYFHERCLVKVKSNDKNENR